MKKKLAVLLTLAMTAALPMTVMAEEVNTEETVVEETATEEVEAPAEDLDVAEITSEEGEELVGTGHTYETATQIKVNTLVTDSIVGQKVGYAYYTEDNYYKFTTTKRGYFTVDFALDSSVDVSSLSYGWNINIYQQGQGGALKTYSNVRTTKKSAKLSLKPGTYCIKISPYCDDSEAYSNAGKKYKFKINEVSDSNWEAEDNNSTNTANAITLGTTYKGTIWNDSDVDWYTFDISTNSKVNINLKPDADSNMEWVGYGWDMYLYAVGNGDSIIYKYNIKSNYDMNTIIPEGKYYVKIEGSYSSVDAVYDMNISATPTKAVAKPAGYKFASYKGYNFYEESDDTIRCYDSENVPVKNAFKCDGTYTYFFQADGSAMKDRLTYHPDGEHIIYFDQNGHEVFSDFTNVKRSISGTPVDDLCFFDVYGYMYRDVITYDKSGRYLYYANEYGVMERNGWFGFSAKQGGGIGYAYSDGTLMTNQFTYDQFGRLVYLGADGKCARGLISDGTYYYEMDATDGHLLKQYPM